MANYANLLATIAANIYQNNNNEVTADMVKAAMNAAVASLGSGFQFMGVATPNTTPGNTDVKQFYLASEPGTYTNFQDSGSNPLEVNDGEVAVLKYDTAWSKEVTGAATAAQVTELGQKVQQISEDDSPVADEDISIVNNNNDEIVGVGSDGIVRANGYKKIGSNKIPFPIDAIKSSPVNEGIVLTDDDGNKLAEINKDGVIYAAGFEALGGGATPITRKRMDIFTTDTELQIFNKLLTCFNEGNYDVYWERGEYEFSDIYVYMRDELGWTWSMELPIGGNCRYFFQNSKISSLPPENYNTQRNLFGCKASCQSFELHDGYLYNNVGTYVIHDETDGKPGYYKHVYHNLHMEYIKGGYTHGCCIGSGTGIDGDVIIDNCIFESKNGANGDIGIHGVYASGSTPDPSKISHVKYLVTGNYFSVGFGMGGEEMKQTDEYCLQFNGNSIPSQASVTYSENVQAFLFNNESRN